MAYEEESNGQVTDKATWPRKIKLVTPMRFEPNISKTARLAILKQSLITR